MPNFTFTNVEAKSNKSRRSWTPAIRQQEALLRAEHRNIIPPPPPHLPMSDDERALFEYYMQSIAPERRLISGTQVCCARLAKIFFDIQKYRDIVEREGEVVLDRFGASKQHPLLQHIQTKERQEGALMARIGLVGFSQSTDNAKVAEEMADLEARGLLNDPLMAQA